MFWIIKHLNTDHPAEQGTPNSIRLIGPFESEGQAAHWVLANNPHDNPWWHVANLGAYPMAAITIMSPDAARVAA